MSVTRPRLALIVRLGSFLANVGVASLLGLLTIPLIVQHAGAEAWGGLALIQTVAQFFGVLVAFGWGVTGPAMVALETPARRPVVLCEAVFVRSGLYILCFLAMSAVLCAMQPRFLVWNLLGATAYLLPYLGANWYFVGEAKPGRLFFLDSLPQFLGTALGLGLFLFFDRVSLFLAGQLLGNAVAVCAGVAFVFSRSDVPLRPPSWRRSASLLKRQWHGVLTAGVGAFYVSLPLTAVTIFHPIWQPVYALADRFLKYGVLAFAPVLQVSQGWIPEGGVGNQRHRMVRAVQVACAFGLGGGLAIYWLAGPVGLWLTSGAIGLTPALLLPIALAFSVVAVSQVVGLACLMILKASWAVAGSTLAGAVLGAPLICLAAALGVDVSLVAWAVTCSEVAVLAFQIIVLRRKLKEQLQLGESVDI